MTPHYDDRDRLDRPRRRHNEYEYPPPPPLTISQWAQIVLKMTASSAVIVIAGFLVWRLSGGFDVFAAKMDVMLQQHAELAVQTRANEMMARRMLVVLRVMCVNAAKNEDARQSCLQESVP